MQAEANVTRANAERMLADANNAIAQARTMEPDDKARLKLLDVAEHFQEEAEKLYREAERLMAEASQSEADFAEAGVDKSEQQSGVIHH